MSKIMPKTASPTEIQRNYRRLFDEVKASEEPLLILSNNKPDVVVISYKQYEAFIQSQEDHEQKMARMAIQAYESEKADGELKELSSLSELA